MRLLFLIVLVFVSLCNSSFAKNHKEVELQPGQTVRDYFDQDFGPRGLEPIGFGEEVPYSLGDKIAWGFAISGQIFDIGATGYQLSGDTRCRERNSLFGDEGSFPLMFVVKAGVLYIAKWYVDEVFKGTPEEISQVRKMVYIPLGAIGYSLGFYNLSLDCH